MALRDEERWDPFRYYEPQNLYEELTDEQTSDIDKIIEDLAKQPQYSRMSYEELYEIALRQASPNAPAELTDRPTSSLNAARPRTVAAGYDENRRILTVVFRDGTVWNYEGVTPGEWQNFQASISKGRPWINDNLFGQGKAADMTGLDADIQASIYEASRKAQVQYRTKRRYKDPETGRATVQRLGKTGVKAANRAVNKSLGKNTSKGGKNPYQP